jgi:hypothetical protein
VKAKLDNPRAKVFTTLNRVFNSSVGREYLKVEKNADHGLLGRTTKSEFVRGFSKLVADVTTGKASSRTLNKNEDIKRYFDSWKQEERPKKKSATFVPSELTDGKTVASMAEWRRQRAIYRSKVRTSRLNRGFAAFYLNRCNRSGIIMNGGPIGGIKQEGDWLINARFNKPELQRRCEKIAEYRDRIHVSGDDGIEFVQDPSRTLCFIDPCVYRKPYPSLSDNRIG